VVCDVIMSSVKVAVRVRPFNSRELTRECDCIIAMSDNTTSTYCQSVVSSLAHPHSHVTSRSLIDHQTHPLKPCPHCRRKVRMSPNYRKVRLSPNSATVSLFYDSVDRALCSVSRDDYLFGEFSIWFSLIFTCKFVMFCLSSNAADKIFFDCIS